MQNPKKINKEGENIMRRYFIYLAVIILCLGCQKREAAVVQENAESSGTITVAAPEVAAADDIIIQAEDIITQPVQAEIKTIQETIENYCTDEEIYGTYEGRFTFQIEGNFTGSGNREVIAFYEYRVRDSILGAFCFVCDSAGENIENVYYIEYGTIAFDERNDADTGLVENTNLGRAITYKDRIIGRVSDFNGNGIEELYFYIRTGMNILPHFYEFNGAEFEEIIELKVYSSAPIVSIDPKEKVIILSLNNPVNEEGVDRISSIISYIWDNTARKYEKLTSEVKKYKWNRNTREYEEIE
jgi:hypothetical protein